MDLALDNDGDLDTSIRLTAGVVEIAKQQLTIQLRTFLGEWFLDSTVGVPYFRDVLVKNPDVPLVRTLFRNKILRNQHVESVPRLELSLSSDRTLSVDFDALLKDGSLITVTV